MEVSRKIIPNAGQKLCIESLNGPIMVLAGPGTGKTFTIIQRIKFMIEQGILPEAILCLTYSEAAANEMKARLVKELGTIASAVTISTYHAFCNEIIRQNPAEFELLDGVTLVDDITKRTLMSDVIKEFKPEFYKTKWGDSYYYIPELLNAVDEIKKNRIDKETYFDILKTSPAWQGKMNDLEIEYKEREAKGKLVKTFLATYEGHKKKIGKAIEAWDIIEKYDIKLKQNNYVDFNDMINLVLDKFATNVEFRKQIGTKYTHFLVDEYQDTNYQQNEIVFQLANGANSENIFVVGDDDQIIYEFQGAKTDTLEKFLERFPNTKVICLNENNRSTQNILDFSYDVIRQDLTRLEAKPEFKKFDINKKLVSKNPTLIQKNKNIQIHNFADIKQENNFIVESIEQLKNTVADLSQIAILTRENGELLDFAELLMAKNIPFQVKSSKSIFSIKSSILLYFYIKMLENHELFADKIFGLLISKPFDFELADYNFLLEQNRLNHLTFLENIKLNINHEWANKEKVQEFIKTFDELKEFKSKENLKNLIILIANKTGILKYFTESEINKIENIFGIKRLVDEAQSFMNAHPECSLLDFITHLDTAFECDIPITIDRDDYTQNAIQLVTLHGAKGREFEYVFMPNLIAKKWEKKRISNTNPLPISYEEVDSETKRFSEQLRLLFVGITRAKHSLFISFSNTIDGKSQELTQHLAQVIQNSTQTENFTHELTQQDYSLEIVKSLLRQDFDYKNAFKSELEARLKDFVLSPSSLNSYLACPRNFLYTHILQIPVYDKDWNNANYGSAIHKTLELTIQKAKEIGAYLSKDEICDLFVKCLAQQKFPSKEIREQYIQRGKKSLCEYYHHFIETNPDSIEATELQLKYVPLEDNFLKGFIDRVEKLSDGTFALYDYKTGTAKPKSQITDGGNYQHYLNQLRFYKLAFETQNSGSKVSRVGLIFVEDVGGSFYATLTEDDNTHIKEQILNTYKNLKELNFDCTKDEKQCEFCNYKQLCSLTSL